MLDDPGLDPDEIAKALERAYGIGLSSLTFVPGYDLGAASYDVGDHFLKVRFGPVDEAVLAVPRALVEVGVPNILAPIRTRRGQLWSPMGERSLVLYPLVRAPNAVDAGMTQAQWRIFGETLRAVHDSGLERAFVDRLPAEAFEAAAAASVREVLGRPPAVESGAAGRLTAFFGKESKRITAMLERAEELGERLRSRRFARELCHADIHAANILVADDGGILLVDWDGPMLAPRDRDLLFVIGSRIARRVEPHEEAWFFEGYGSVEVDTDALVYYRYERVLEDIAVDAASILGDPSTSEETRAGQVDLIESFFAAGNILEAVEDVTRCST